MTAPKSRPLKPPEVELIPAKERISGKEIAVLLDRARAEWLEKHGRFLTEDEIRAELGR